MTMEKILRISDFLEKRFKGKIIYHFQIHEQDGFEYKNLDRFSASNSLPLEFSNIDNSFENKMTFRFLCGVKKKLQTKNRDLFFNQIDKHHLKDKSPLFFVIPYFPIENDPKEDFYACRSQCEIILDFSENSFQMQCLNYSNIDVNSMKDEIGCILNGNSISYPVFQNNSSQKKVMLPRTRIKNQIKKTIDHMINGDCYLANITYRKKIKSKKKFISAQHFIVTWFELKSRYGIFYHDKDHGISCFSPERFLLCKNRLLVTEPIKGTLSTKGKDEFDAAHEIWNDKKEIYEHTMVVDLLRNDLNDICEPGSVFVFRPFYLKKSQNLLQMQSSILGKLNDHMTMGSCLLSMLPAGSITGTPKKRVCQIIQEQEKQDRGYYTGVCGILGKNGDMDSCILIRSLFKGNKGIYLGVGAGITTLSHPDKEVDEFYEKSHSFSFVLRDL